MRIVGKKAPTNGAARRVSRRDVAEAAGVSLALVTHALKGTPGFRIAPATQARIRQIAADRGYRPAYLGRALGSGKTQTLGFLQPSLETIHYDLYQRILHGLAGAMEEDGCHLLLLFQQSDFRYLRAIQDGRMDGVFVIQSVLGVEHIEQVLGTGLPTVILNKDYPTTSPTAGCVRTDQRRFIRDMLAEFVGCGCRRILLLSDYRTTDANVLMYAETRAAARDLAQRGVVCETVIPAFGDLRPQLADLFGGGASWDGIFVGVRIADRVVAAGRELGLEPGRNYELITSDWIEGITSSAQVERSVYTQQPDEVGRQGWHLMKNLLDGTATQHLELVPYLRRAVAGSARA